MVTSLTVGTLWYAINQLRIVERLASEIGLDDRLHLWPDPSLISKAVLGSYDDPPAINEWVLRYHHRVSEWPEAMATVDPS